MATETGKEQSKATWSSVKFAFRVTIGDTEILFQEVTGLNAEAPVIEYRAVTSKEFSTVKMPGMKKYNNVTLNKGVFKDDKALSDMYHLVVTETFERKKITISLLDETNAVAMSWELINAFPVKMTTTDTKSGDNNATVVTMELAHQGLIIVK